MKKRFILPKKIPLPGGFVIRIQQVVMTTDETADWTYSSDGNGGVIRLKQGMTQKQQKYYLAHELQHALIDYLHLFLEDGARP